ncbi:P-loop containing nucleoside triphosphate hydrolase protein [Hypoxylon sp. NC1633]|nr:P-loop containing nucleoside triphosphate hydrolase protein [Hypoxylon sp. NC1633]
MADDNQQQLDAIKHHVNYEPPPPIPGQEWRSYPELPTSQDLNPDWNDPQQLAEINCLLPNTWREPWKSKSRYLETHYRLQREEAITMLRYSIRKFKQNPAMLDDEETCVYTKVFVKGYFMTRLGPMCQVQFSTERSGKKIRWTQTRRLTVGTLVALSTASDRFKTICMPAIISDHRIRDGLDRNPPTIHFQWANPDDAIMDPSEELVMIETRLGYFEAVRHTMVGLQHVAGTDSPLDKYLVQADKSDLPARYIEQNPQMDIRSLVHHVPDSGSMTTSEKHAKMAEVSEPLRDYLVLDGLDGELSRYTNLDNSQLSAVHRILTKELAIVQGPPGTGKTFTSVQALQILLESQEKGSNVIIVAAQTNHAVDQILMQLINAGFEVARLGGRTQNEVIKRHSMYNIRRRRSMPLSTHRADRDFKTFDSARRKNIVKLEEVIEDVFPNELVDLKILHSVGIITKSQLESIANQEPWTTAASLPEQPTGLLAEWLGTQLVKVRPADDKDPDFEAIEDEGLDLDIEDYELDPDDCIVDDDEDANRIDGKFLPIRHQWTGANPDNYSENDFVIQRELKRENLWDVDLRYRGAVYRYWQKRLLSLHTESFRHILVDNIRITKNLKINRWYKDIRCIKSQQIEIVGCTTTGLCKYRGLLSALRPRTMLIEEAAETREANILSALYGSLQQLILVGDHQQLAPHCDTPGLGDAPYYMRVSMFERLVNLQMPFTMLNMQRRMIPSLREVLNPFYPDLKDHPVVTRSDARPPVPGMAVPSFFFHHTWTEGLDENLSRYNILEAEMIVRFIDYLLMNGVQSSQITVLTFYRGQKKKIMAQLKTKLKHWAPFTNVFTVDSYQGEENEIVILSLVRSRGRNGPHQAGFLQDENRGVVSISRARRGLYIFGNMINLTHASSASWSLWGRVQQVFTQQGRFGGNSRLPITCQNHGKTTWMSHPEDWVNCHGGCDLRCPDKLSCGHACGRQCHWVSHEKLICREPCEKILACGHRCQHVCGENCLCSCAGFTGAYAHDEFLDEEATLKDEEVRAGYDQARVATPTTQDQRRMGAPTGSRGDGRGSTRGGRHPRGSRRGLVQNGAGHRTLNRNLISTAAGYQWANFDADMEDEQKRREIREAYASNTFDDPMAVDDTFRAVTLNDRGSREMGERLTVEKSAMPSTGKDGDLLTFDATAKAMTPSMVPLTMNGGVTGAGSPTDVNGKVGGMGAGTTQDYRRRTIALVDSSRFSRPSVPRQTLPRAGASMSRLSRKSANTRQIFKPEWESSSVKDTGSVTAVEDTAENMEAQDNAAEDKAAQNKAAQDKVLRGVSDSLGDR